MSYQTSSKWPQAAQIWWDRWEQTSHQASTRRNNNLSSQDHSLTRGIQVNTINIKCHPTKKKFDPQQTHKWKDRCSKSGDSKHIEGLKCPAKSSRVKLVTSMDILQVCVTRNLCLSSVEYPKHISCKLVRCTCKKIPYVASQKIWPPVMNLFVFKWKYNAYKLVPRFPQHLILLPTWYSSWSHITKEISTWEPD